MAKDQADLSDVCHASITVVTVTYGRRWKYLRQVVERALSSHIVDRVVIVDNASDDGIAAQVASEPWDSKVDVLEMHENSGSAKGYKFGIKKALETSNSRFIYLLDDDNLPSPDALELLLKMAVSQGSNPSNAFLSMRSDRPELVEAAKTGQPVRHIRNSFSGFHLLKFLSGKINKFPSKIIQHPLKASDQLVELDFAPYGGLLMHRDLVDVIGYPDESYYLYADDHDYTSRIVSQGGKIFLLSESIVDDIETSWHLSATEGAHPLYSRANSEFRVFYSVRNRVALEKRFLIDNRFIYYANMVIYLGFRCIHALAVERDIKSLIRRNRLLYLAISDGLSERLGRSFKPSGSEG